LLIDCCCWSISSEFESSSSSSEILLIISLYFIHQTNHHHLIGMCCNLWLLYRGIDIDHDDHDQCWVPHMDRLKERHLDTRCDPFVDLHIFHWWLSIIEALLLFDLKTVTIDSRSIEWKGLSS
jgi:hypothetical protein